MRIRGGGEAEEQREREQKREGLREGTERGSQVLSPPGAQGSVLPSDSVSLGSQGMDAGSRSSACSH